MLLRPLRFFTALMVGLLLPGLASADITYDAGADFSTASNPNGVWTYGSTATLGGAFTAYSTPSIDVAETQFWSNAAPGQPATLPAVYENANTGLDGTAMLTGGQIALHPGMAGEYSVVRFTAAIAAIYNLSSTFLGIEENGTTTDVHILYTDNTTTLATVSLFDGAVNGYAYAANNPQTASTSYSNPIVALNVGDTLDFVVGVGADGDYSGDSTGLVASLSAVPEPSSVLMLGAGLAGVVGLARRKKRAATA